jgi:carboxylesterase type B
LKISELDGLNLNITVPLIQGQLPAPEHKLPVFVWVHGGAFAVGSNSWPQVDHERLVKLSAEIGLPVIGIGIK